MNIEYCDQIVFVMASGYTRGEVLGQGAFGTVYKATRTCALKSIDISALRDHERAARKKEWKQEVKSLLRVRGHENIVEYRNSFASFDNKLWLELEYCNGGTLNDYAIKKKPGRDIKHRFFLEISAGVAFLHENGIVHRDLKPDNIMICIDEDNQPHCKVGDFGLAKVLADCNFSGQVLQYYLASECGTEYFMAPEVYDGHYTEKADIFSMGVIFCTMVPNIYWQTFGGKKYLVVRLNGESYAKFMKRTGKDIIFKKNYDGMSKNVIKLLDSTRKLRYSDRPTAVEVNTSLKSISPKELCMLAQPPAASP